MIILLPCSIFLIYRSSSFVADVSIIQRTFRKQTSSQCLFPVSVMRRPSKVKRAWEIKKDKDSHKKHYFAVFNKKSDIITWVHLLRS